MTSIKWGPAEAAGGFDSGLGRLRALTPDPQGTIAALRERAEEHEQARTALTLTREGDTLADALAQRVQRLTDAVEAFRWPNSDSPLLNGRLAESDAALTGKVTGSFPDNPAPYFRFYTRGFDKSANAAEKLGLAPGEYEFSLSRNGETEDLSVTLTADSSMDDLLDAVADALNDSDLPVQAQRIRQGSPYLRAAGQPATGDSLAIGVNPAYGSENPVLRDTSGHLLAALKLRENTAASGPADMTRYDLENRTAQHPSSFASVAVDPGAAPSMAAGTYNFEYAYGPDAGSFSIDVESDDTWNDVLDRFANAANSAQNGFRVRQVERERLSDLLTTGQWGDLKMNGLALDITATDPKLGQRLSLSGADDDSTGFLTDLRLNSTAVPGMDASMRINGEIRTRAPGIFSEDGGRVLLEQTDASGSGAVTVRSAYDAMTERMSDITEAYNDLRSFLLPNQGYFETGLSETWRAPLQNGTAGNLDITDLGLREIGKDKLLWFDHDTFFSALGAEPEQAHDLLLDNERGLFTQWAQLGDGLLSHPATDALAEPSSLPDPFHPDLSPRTEADLERRSSLLDLLDMDTPDFSIPSGNGLLNRRG